MRGRAFDGIADALQHGATSFVLRAQGGAYFLRIKEAEL
jgi:hypothetical protein